MPRQQTNGIDLVYEEAGRGEPIVFISGTSVDRRFWGPQVAELAVTHRCITFDNRDVGESTQVAGSYTPADMARDTAGLLTALDVPAAHVVGHSLGGAVAQELALLAPDLVRSLVLVGSWARNDEYTRALFRTWKRMRTTFDDRAFLEAQLLTGVGHTFINTVGMDAMVELFLDAPHPQMVDAFVRQVDCDLAHDTADRIGRIGQPTLVVAGQDDVIFPPPHHRMLADGIPGAGLLLFPAVGHSPPIENAPGFAQALAEFVASH